MKFLTRSHGIYFKRFLVFSLFRCWTFSSFSPLYPIRDWLQIFFVSWALTDWKGKGKNTWSTKILVKSLYNFLLVLSFLIAYFYRDDMKTEFSFSFLFFLFTIHRKQQSYKIARFCEKKWSNTIFSRNNLYSTIIYKIFSNLLHF